MHKASICTSLVLIAKKDKGITVLIIANLTKLFDIRVKYDKYVPLLMVTIMRLIAMQTMNLFRISPEFRQSANYRYFGINRGGHVKPKFRR